MCFHILKLTCLNGMWSLDVADTCCKLTKAHGRMTTGSRYLKAVALGFCNMVSLMVVLGISTCGQVEAHAWLKATTAGCTTAANCAGQESGKCFVLPIKP